MISFKHIKLTVLTAITAIALVGAINFTPTATAEQSTVQEVATVAESNIEVTPLTLVCHPQIYLNKNIIMKAKFDKFSTLGLDYKPAMKSSEDYISFLVKREDTTHNIPLSELKLFLKRDVAEKFIDLKTNDIIEIQGKVFSTALGDPWVDVNKLTVIQKFEEVKKDGVQ